jgi:hypothetical protein
MLAIIVAVNFNITVRPVQGVTNGVVCGAGAVV